MTLMEVDDNLRFLQRIEEINLILRPFRDLIIFHERFRQASDDLLRRIVALPPGSLIYLVGPTGVGKTAMLHTLINRFSLGDADKHGGHAPRSYNSPPIYVEAASPQKHAFEWRDFDIRLLKKLQEPGVWHKADLDFELKRLREGITKTNNARKMPSDWLLFQCLEDALKACKPPFACIDEAHIIKKMVSTAATFEDQMDVLKSIANLTKVTLVLSGTYKMKDLIYEGDETTRRSRVVHFGRYLSSGKDIEDFVDFLAALTKESPLKLDFDPLQHLHYFYLSSTGCSGTLKDWYCAANCEAMLNERDMVSIEDFKAAVLDKKQLVKLVKEINAFEGYFHSCPDSDIVDAFWKGDGGGNNTETESNKVAPEERTKPRLRKRPKPGEIKPTRFPLTEEPTDDNAQTP